MGKIADKITYWFFGGWLWDMFCSWVKIENKKVKG